MFRLCLPFGHRAYGQSLLGPLALAVPVLVLLIEFLEDQSLPSKNAPRKQPVRGNSLVETW